MTVHSITQTILEGDYVASEALRRDLLNLNAYAESIKNKVEKELGEAANEKAIAVALSRIAKEPIEEKTFEGKLFKDFNVKSNFTIISLEKKLAEKPLNEWRKKNLDAHRFSQLYTYGTCSIIVSEDEKKSLLSFIPKDLVISVHGELYLMTAMFHKDHSKDKYVALTVIKEISNKGINIYSHFLSPLGVGLLIEQADLVEATEVFTKFIHR